MPAEALRIAAFGVYLGAWLLLGVIALVHALTRLRGQCVVTTQISMPSVVGMLMQGTAALPITLALKDSPLRPTPTELIGTIVLAPLAVAIYYWSLRSAATEPQALLTQGAYAWLRHPMYLAFLAMLVATGFVVSAGASLVAAVALFVTGTELRVATEEAELQEKFSTEYENYRLKTRWRYLPGLR